MKHRFVIFTSLFFSFMLTCCTHNVECKDGINTLPMYGKVEKCKAQLDADKEFLALSDQNEPDRAVAAAEMLETGWYYVHHEDYDTAMKRFNQAWLLDSTNITVYASFAFVLDLTGKTEDAIGMLDLTFEKLKFRKDPEEVSFANLTNEEFVELLVSTSLLVFQKTNNPSIGKYLYKKLNDLNIPELKKEALRNLLKEKMEVIS